MKRVLALLMALQVWQLAAIEVIYPNGGNGGSSGGGGGGGAYASNYIFTPTLETWYPNSTAYEARPLVNVFLESASAANAIAVFEVDTNADNTADLSYRQLLTKVGADNVANSAWFTYSVLPGWQWRVTDASSGGGTVSIDATAPNGNGIWYYATNGGTGGGSGDVTAAGLAAGSYPVAGSAVTGALTNRAARTLESVGPQFMRQYSTPPIGFGSWGVFTTEFGNSSGSGYGTNSQTWLTNIIALVKANPELVSAGMDTLYIDDGWQNDVRTGSGDLTWNTNFFPLGIPALAALAKEAGLKLHLYTSVHTQTCMSMPGSGTNNIYRDVQKMMSWNIAGTMVDQCDSGSSWYDTNLLTEFSYLTASAIRDYQANAFASNQPANPFFVHMTTGNGPGTLPQVITWQGLNFYDGIGVSDGYSDSSLVPAISIAGKNSLKLLASWIKPGHSPMFNWLYSGNVAGESIQLTNHINVGIMICGMGKMGVGDRIGQWIAGGTDLGGYGPGPSWTRFTNYFLPNLSNPELMGLWKDPAVIPGKVITTNSLTELWVRKIGSEVGPTNVIYLVNAATTNYTFTLNVNQFGGFSNQLYALRNPWTRTTVGLFSNTVPITVPISNGVLYAVYPVSGLRTVSGGVVALGSGDFEQSIAAPITINGFTYTTASNEVASARWTLKNSSGSEQTVSFPGAFTSSGSATFTVSNSTISEFNIYRTSIRTQIMVNTYQLAAAFTPASVSGMVAWFRPENLSSYSNGDVVTNWSDASGNGYNATNVLGSAPLKVSSSINGLAGVAFTGAKHLRHLIGDYATSTIFAVVQRTNTGTGYQGIFYAGASSSAGTMMLANLSTANKWGVYTTVEQASSTQLTSATTPVVLSMVDNGASGGTFYTNGVANGTWTGNTIGSSEPTIGGSAAQLFTGYISEVIFFTGALSGTDRAAVESYLRGKYGL